MKNRRNIEIKNLFHKYKLLFLVMAVVAVSGCIIPGVDISSMFPQFRPATAEASSDLITTQNLNVIPNPPISAENAFTVSFEVRNNDENEEVKNVIVTPYDYGLCAKSSGAGAGGGGTITETDIVKALPSTRVISLKADCGNGKTDIILLEENVEKTPDKICDTANSAKFKASVKDYTITLTKGGSALSSGGCGQGGKNPSELGRSTCAGLEYAKFDPSVGKLWDCLEGSYGDNSKYKDNCFLKDGSILYSLISAPEFKERAQCLGKSQCFRSEDKCSEACNKRNTDCKGSAEKKVGCYARYGSGGNIKEDSELLTACNNQCDKYKYEVQQAETAPCNPLIESQVNSQNKYIFDVYGDYDGVCCVCDISSQPIDTSVSSSAASTTADSKKFPSFFPLQTELIELSLKAPSNSGMGNMPRDCGIKYKINYDFTSRTQTDVSVISESKMTEMQRAGQAPSANPTQSVGVGPIKVFFDFGVKQPLKSKDVLPIFITVEDRGAGVYGSVPARKLEITIPPGFDFAAPDSCGKFAKSGNKLTNKEAIPMIKKKSPQLRCSFKTPSVTDIKTFFFNAKLDYTYKFDNEIKVSINPTLVK